MSMKLHYLFNLFLCLFIHYQANTQIIDKDSSNVSKCNKRFYMDFSAFGAWNGKINDIQSGVFGVQMKFGNDFKLRPIHENLYFRLNWLRLGLILGDGSGLILTPLHIGLGYQQKLSKNLTLEPKISGGMYLGTDDILVPSFEFDFGVIPALSIVTRNNFIFEVEYVRRKNFLGYTGQMSYLNLSLGTFF